VKGDLFTERIGLPSSFHRKQAARHVSYHRVTKAGITELCTLIEEHGLPPGTRPWPPIPGLRNALTATLAYLRRNRVQAEIAEDYDVSPPTISRAISATTPLLVTALADFVPTADDLDPGWYSIVDGALLPCWTWRAHPGLKSGKHRASGLKVLLACTINGRLMWISDPVNGGRHDMYCLKESGLLEETDPSLFSGDTRFVGSSMITPIRKPRTRDLQDWEKEFNTQVAKFRWVIEQVIANFKTWRIMHTDYRRPLETFAETISAAVALHFYVLA
jgi:DDE superfamily endonuclease